MITRTIFESQLNCRYKGYLHQTLGAGRAETNDYIDLVRRLDEEYRSKLRFVLFPNRDSDQVTSVSRTRALMDEGAATIVNGTLGFDGFEVAVDALEKRRGRSSCGAYHYQPVLFKQKLASTNDKLVLGFFGLILSKMQDRLPEHGTIISGNGYKTLRIRLPKLINCAKKELEVLLSQKDEPQIFLNSHCKQCEYEHTCNQKARESDNLSLIQSLSKKEILKLNAKGIFTVTQLSYTFRPRRKRKGPLILKDNPALRALAIRERKIYIVEPPKVSSGRVALYVDVEGIPDENFVYLIGILAVDAGGRKLYQFWADTRSEQEKIWHQFAHLIKGFESPIIFHHGNYDAVFFRKMQAAHGGFEDTFLKDNVVNTVSLLFGRIFFPTFSNGLKEIANFLGFKWASKDVSGLQSIQWRKTWENSVDGDLKSRIMQYNQDDCQALELLVNKIRALDGPNDKASAIYCNDLKNKKHFGLNPNTFAFQELTLINKAAYFDYQHSKIFWRTDKSIQKRQKRIEKARSRKNRINKIINLAPPKHCPRCQSRKVEQREKISRIIFDLKFTDSGVKRWIVQYKGHRFNCKKCKKYFLPIGHPESQGKYGHGLLAWSVYQYIGLRQSLENVAKCIRELFGIHLRGANAISEFKEQAANLYRSAYDEILEKIRCGHLIHIDETKVSILGATAYVWVFANLEEVAYVYSANREGTILAEIIPEFKGVVISDYYPAYDGLECKQQRCLIHLIRDLNDDLFRNQFDGEFKIFVQKFGELLKPIIETIDKYGLKKHYLRRYKKAVARFFKIFVISDGKSELLQKYQKRFIRNQDRLFTFLDHDGVPWNNNNAENAIKGFATLRKVIGGTSTEKGLKDSLALLSICQTLRNKGLNTLDFLRSKDVSLYEFLEKERRTRTATVL